MNFSYNYSFLPTKKFLQKSELKRAKRSLHTNRLWLTHTETDSPTPPLTHSPLTVTIQHNSLSLPDFPHLFTPFTIEVKKFLRPSRLFTTQPGIQISTT